MHWAEIKLFLETATGISNDATHVVLGVCAQISIALVLRIPVSRAMPWGIVLLAQIGNEALDLRDDWGSIPLQWGEAAKDTILTLFLPSVILLVSRRLPRVFSEFTSQTNPADRL